MTIQNSSDGLDDAALSVIQGANRYYQEVTVTKVTGECPYGHKDHRSNIVSRFCR